MRGARPVLSVLLALLVLAHSGGVAAGLAAAAPGLLVEICTAEGTRLLPLAGEDAPAPRHEGGCLACPLPQAVLPGGPLPRLAPPSPPALAEPPPPAREAAARPPAHAPPYAPRAPPLLA